VVVTGHMTSAFSRETESDAQASDASFALFRVLGALCTASGEHQTRLLQSLLQCLLHAKSTVDFSTEHQTRLSRVCCLRVSESVAPESAGI
jgi:hypothetical protein